MKPRNTSVRWVGVVFGLLLALAVRSEPLVSNIVAGQRAGTKLVDMTYDLTDAEHSALAVTIRISQDAGATWDVPCPSVTGDGIGLAVTPGAGKAMVWDAGADWNGQWSDRMQVEVTATVVTYLVVDLSGGPEAARYPVSALAAAPAGGWTDEYKTTRLVLRRIPAGAFTMGSPVDELGREGAETQHPVTLTQEFYLGVFEVTQKHYERVMGVWPSFFTNPSYREARPVELVSWDDVRGGTWPGGLPGAATFMGKLRDRTGLPLDLPTEAQWEYACRAGTATALNSGKNLTGKESCPNMDEVGRYGYNGASGASSASDATTGSAHVGDYLPNSQGLYDMHGNVWEWCLDWYAAAYPATATDPLGADSGSNRVVRGGSWNYRADYCRSGLRNQGAADYRCDFIGFRVCSAAPVQ